MTLIRTIFAELLGLFVDDWAFALLLLVWVGLFALPLRHILGALAGPTLFLGLAALTLVLWHARPNRKQNRTLHPSPVTNMGRFGYS